MSNKLSSIDEIQIFCHFFFLSGLSIWASIRIAIEIIYNIIWWALVGIKINFNLKYHHPSDCVYKRISSNFSRHHFARQHFDKFYAVSRFCFYVHFFRLFRLFLFIFMPQNESAQSQHSTETFKSSVLFFVVIQIFVRLNLLG